MSFWDQLKNWLRPPKPPIRPPDATDVDKCLATVALINAQRKDHGLRPFDPDAHLASFSQGRVNAMAATDTLAHGDWARRFTEAFPTAAAGSENIASGQRLPSEVVEDWMGSPGHRRNILGQYGAVGVGYAVAPDREPYWCANFARFPVTRDPIESEPITNADLPGPLRRSP